MRLFAPVLVASALLLSSFAFAFPWWPSTPTEEEILLNLIKAKATASTGAALEKALAIKNEIQQRVTKRQAEIDGKKDWMKKQGFKEKDEAGTIKLDERRQWTDAKAEIEKWEKEVADDKLKLAAATTAADEADKEDAKKRNAQPEDHKEDLTTLTTALAGLNLMHGFDQLKDKLDTQEAQLAALVAKADGALLGAYVREKLERAFQPKEFCPKLKECTNRGDATNENAPAPSMKGLFDRKTHGGK